MRLSARQVRRQGETQFFLAGADVFRLNFSHGEHDGHAARIEAIREIEKKYLRSIEILADVQGPKLRLWVPFGQAGTTNALRVVKI